MHQQSYDMFQASFQKRNYFIESCSDGPVLFTDRFRSSRRQIGSEESANSIESNRNRTRHHQRVRESAVYSKVFSLLQSEATRNFSSFRTFRRRADFSVGLFPEDVSFARRGDANPAFEAEQGLHNCQQEQQQRRGHLGNGGNILLPKQWKGQELGRGGTYLDGALKCHIKL